MAEFVAGQRVTINGSSDLMMDYDARAFIGKPCIVISKTKGGLVYVALIENPKLCRSFAKRNVEEISG